MRGRVGAAVSAIVLLAHPPAALSGASEFQVQSADGIEIRGESTTNSSPPRIAVIFVPGTGLFNRDAAFGESGTSRDLIFKDLAQRMVARGVSTVRYDLRGVRYGAAPDKSLDHKLLAGRTTNTMRDDLAAVYEWSRSLDGLGARCIAFFAHSEGMLHVARLVDLGAPSPALVIGMGAAMESPAQIVRWQFTERDAYSLEMMDADHNGVITNEEVRANWLRTPSAVHGKLEPYLHPAGAWNAKDLAALRATQAAIYSSERLEMLSHADSDPYPNADEASEVAALKLNAD